MLYSDNVGSDIGMDPTNAVVVDLSAGIGCIARDTVVNVKGDLWFLDTTGVHSLSRLIQTENNPITNISRNVMDELQEYISLANAEDLRAEYSPRDRFYLLAFPVGSGSPERGVTFCFDTRGLIDDGSARCAGVWNQLVPRAMVARDNEDLLIAYSGSAGRVGKYEGFQDNGQPYIMDYESGWTDLGGEDSNPYQKILKRISGLFFIEAATSVAFKWAFDFDEIFKTATAVYRGTGVAAEWNNSEWGTALWGGGARMQEKNVAGRGTGEYIKAGFSVEINSNQVACQQLAMYAKQGRLN